MMYAGFPLFFGLGLEDGQNDESSILKKPMIRGCRCRLWASGFPNTRGLRSPVLSNVDLRCPLRPLAELPREKAEPLPRLDGFHDVPGTDTGPAF